MSDLFCKKCGSIDYIKNGRVRGLQRYKCKNPACVCNCVASDKRTEKGVSQALKSLCSLLYSVGGMSFNGIGRILQVSNSSVAKWIKEEAEKIEAPQVPDGTTIVILDEMWHFLKKN